VVAPLGLHLAGLLQRESHGDARREEPRSCIFIYQYGGLSQLDSWDPKPHAPAELRGPYLPISTSVPGLQVGELMPHLARQADRCAVLRSLSHSVPVHDIANRMLLSGRTSFAADDPSLGAIVTKLRPATTNVPSHVWLQKFGGGAAPPDPSYLTGGFLGMAHAPMLLGTGHEDNLAAPGYKIRVFESADGVAAERLDRRRELLAAVDQMASGRSGSPATASVGRFQERAFDLLQGPAARRAFDVEEEPDTLRDRYGRNPLGQNLLLARRLIEAGVRLVNVVAWTGLAEGDTFMSLETWDMHGNAGIGIFDNGWNGLGFALPRCDQAVATLLEDLADRGLLDSTLVVLVGEFGRTPRISRGAKAIGRDHWPNCYSGMLAGAGIRGGLVYGSSDAQAAYVQDRPISPENFAATVLHALGIPPETRLSPDGFTRPASLGQPVLDLFG